MHKTLYTIGYGNDPPDKFLERLREAGIDLVIDVRYYEAARLGCYRATGHHDRGMSALLAGISDEPVDMAIEYMWALELGKEKDMPLDEFCSHVLETDSGYKFIGLASWWTRRRKAVCILCCERDAYKDGEVNCHRVYVADALVKMLGPEWSVVHL